MNLFLRRLVIGILSVFMVLGWLVSIPFMVVIGWLSREPSDIRETCAEVFGTISRSVREGHL